MPWRSKILKTPTCAMPRAKPPPRASPIRGRGPLAVSGRPKPIREVITPNERAIDRPKRSALSARQTVNEYKTDRPKACTQPCCVQKRISVVHFHQRGRGFRPPKQLILSGRKIEV